MPDFAKTCVFRTRTKNKTEYWRKNWTAKNVNFFRKTLHLRCLTGFWTRLCLPLCLQPHYSQKFPYNFFHATLQWLKTFHESLYFQRHFRFCFFCSRNILWKPCVKCINTSIFKGFWQLGLRRIIYSGWGHGITFLLAAEPTMVKTKLMIHFNLKISLLIVVSC